MLIYNSLYGQDNFENIQLTIKASAITGHHTDKLIKFPIGYTDASLTPKQQQYGLGYDLSTEISTDVNRRFSSGIEIYLTQFSFDERGSELLYWSGQTSDYSLSREFTMLGVGISSEFKLINQELSNLSLNTGLSYDIMLSNKNIFLGGRSENNSKYSFNCGMEYTHKVSKYSNLLVGFVSRFGLNDYFSTINYKPIRYGVSLGMEMVIYNKE